MNDLRMGFKNTILQCLEEAIPEKLPGSATTGLTLKQPGRMDAVMPQPQVTDFSISRILGESVVKVSTVPARTSSIRTTATVGSSTITHASSSPGILDLSKGNRSTAAMVSYTTPFHQDSNAVANAKLYAQFFPHIFPAYHQLLASHPVMHSKRYFAPFVLNNSNLPRRITSSNCALDDGDSSFSCASTINGSRNDSFVKPKACSRNCSEWVECYYQQLSDKASSSAARSALDSGPGTSYLKRKTSEVVMPNSSTASEHSSSTSSTALISLTTVTNLNISAKMGKLDFKNPSAHLFAPEEISYKCRICDKVFGCSQTLQAHERTHKSPRYECTDCGKGFSQLRNYKYHLSVHRGTKEFAAECPECGKTFNDKGYLSSHMKIHRNKKEYECPYCPKSFNQRVAFNMHVRIHTGVKPHKCAECGKRFSRKMLLKQHMRTHSGEKPYQCSVCGKSFADRSNMTLHHRLHSGIKPFNCPICPKAFTKKHHLKTHLNYHTGCKPYVCPHPSCNQAFSQSSNMRTHAKKCQFRPLQQISFSGLPATLPTDARIPIAETSSLIAGAVASTANVVFSAATQPTPAIAPSAIATASNTIFPQYVSNLSLCLPPTATTSAFAGDIRMLSAASFASQSALPSPTIHRF